MAKPVCPVVACNRIKAKPCIFLIHLIMSFSQQGEINEPKEKAQSLKYFHDLIYYSVFIKMEYEKCMPKGRW